MGDVLDGIRDLFVDSSVEAERAFTAFEAVAGVQKGIRELGDSLSLLKGDEYLKGVKDNIDVIGATSPGAAAAIERIANNVNLTEPEKVERISKALTQMEQSAAVDTMTALNEAIRLSNEAIEDAVDDTPSWWDAFVSGATGAIQILTGDVAGAVASFQDSALSLSPIKTQIDAASASVADLSAQWDSAAAGSAEQFRIAGELREANLQLNELEGTRQKLVSETTSNIQNQVEAQRLNAETFGTTFDEAKALEQAIQGASAGAGITADIVAEVRDNIASAASAQTEVTDAVEETNVALTQGNTIQEDTLGAVDAHLKGLEEMGVELDKNHTKEIATLETKLSENELIEENLKAQLAILDAQIEGSISLIEAERQRAELQENINRLKQDENAIAAGEEGEETEAISAETVAAQTGDIQATRQALQDQISEIENANGAIRERIQELRDSGADATAAREAQAEVEKDRLEAEKKAAKAAEDAEKDRLKAQEDAQKEAERLEKEKQEALEREIEAANKRIQDMFEHAAEAERERQSQMKELRQATESIINDMRSQVGGAIDRTQQAFEEMFPVSTTERIRETMDRLTQGVLINSAAQEALNAQIALTQTAQTALEQGRVDFARRINEQSETELVVRGAIRSFGNLQQSLETIFPDKSIDEIVTGIITGTLESANSRQATAMAAIATVLKGSATQGLARITPEMIETMISSVTGRNTEGYNDLTSALSENAGRINTLNETLTSNRVTESTQRSALNATSGEAVSATNVVTLSEVVQANLDLLEIRNSIVDVMDKMRDTSLTSEDFASLKEEYEKLVTERIALQEQVERGNQVITGVRNNLASGVMDPDQVDEATQLLSVMDQINTKYEELRVKAVEIAAITDTSVEHAIALREALSGGVSENANAIMQSIRDIREEMDRDGPVTFLGQAIDDIARMEQGLQREIEQLTAVRDALVAAGDAEGASALDKKIVELTQSVEDLGKSKEHLKMEGVAKDFQKALGYVEETLAGIEQGASLIKSMIEGDVSSAVIEGADLVQTIGSIFIKYGGPVFKIIGAVMVGGALITKAITNIVGMFKRTDLSAEETAQRERDRIERINAVYDARLKLLDAEVAYGNIMLDSAKEQLVVQRQIADERQRALGIEGGVTEENRQQVALMLAQVEALLLENAAKLSQAQDALDTGDEDDRAAAMEAGGFDFGRHASKKETKEYIDSLKAGAIELEGLAEDYKVIQDAYQSIRDSEHEALEDEVKLQGLREMLGESRLTVLTETLRIRREDLNAQLEQLRLTNAQFAAMTVGMDFSTMTADQLKGLLRTSATMGIIDGQMVDITENWLGANSALEDFNKTADDGLMTQFELQKRILGLKKDTEKLTQAEHDTQLMGVLEEQLAWIDAHKDSYETILDYEAARLDVEKQIYDLQHQQNEELSESDKILSKMIRQRQKLLETIRAQSGGGSLTPMQAAQLATATAAIEAQMRASGASEEQIAATLAALPKFESGGVAGLSGPQQITVGEKGPEMILPADITRALMEMFNRPASVRGESILDSTAGRITARGIANREAVALQSLYISGGEFGTVNNNMIYNGVTPQEMIGSVKTLMDNLRKDMPALVQRGINQGTIDPNRSGRR